MIEDFIIGLEDAVGEPIIAHELPDVFDWIELGTFGWQREDADIVGYDECPGHMPTGLIHEHDGMGPRCHGSGDFGKMHGHRARVADRQDKPCTLAQGRADRSEDRVVGMIGTETRHKGQFFFS